MEEQGLDLICYFRQLKKQTMYIKQWFSRDWAVRTVTPEKWWTKWVLWLYLLDYCLEKVSRTQTGTRTRRTWWLAFTGRHVRGESCTERNFRVTQRVPLESSRLSPARLHSPWTFSRQEYWSGLPFPSPGDLPNPGIELGSLRSPALWADALLSEPPGKPN